MMGSFRRLTGLMREVIEKIRPQQPPGVQGVFRRARRRAADYRDPDGPV